MRRFSNIIIYRSAFLRFKDGIYLDHQAGQYKYGGHRDTTGTIHFFFIKNSRIGTGTTSHQEHTQGNDRKPGQHPYIIVFGKKRWCIVF